MVEDKTKTQTKSKISEKLRFFLELKGKTQKRKSTERSWVRRD